MPFFAKICKTLNFEAISWISIKVKAEIYLIIYTQNHLNIVFK